MSASDNEFEDVKPDIKPDIDSKPESKKIQIEVGHEGRVVRFSVRTTQKLSKVFTAAAKQWNMDESSLKFSFGNTRLRGHETPEELEMEDGDLIDAHLQQLGGGRARSGSDPNSLSRRKEFLHS